MSQTFFIKPTRSQVRDPETMRPLAKAGETKPRNAYWLRRLRDGDIEIASPDAPASSESTKTSKRKSA